LVLLVFPNAHYLLPRMEPSTTEQLSPEANLFTVNE
jgi:hypothetical protein